MCYQQFYSVKSIVPTNIIIKIKNNVKAENRFVAFFVRYGEITIYMYFLICMQKKMSSI